MTAIKVSGGNYDEMMRVLQVELHDDVAILRTGDAFADDFGKVVAQFGIG